MLRVPCESMRKTFKATQRHLERNIEILNTTAQSLVNKTNSTTGSRTTLLSKKDHLLSTASSESVTPSEDASNVTLNLDNAIAIEAATGYTPETSEMLGQIDTMIGRAKGLKRKISSLRGEHERHVGKAKARIGFLSQLYNEDMQIKGDAESSSSSDKYKEWTKTRLDMLLIDYCLRNGQPITAEKLAKTQNIEMLVDIEELQQCNDIEQQLIVGHSTAKCQVWCQENRQFLKKTRSNLEFQIKLQQYIELARARNFTEAIAYYRSNLIKNAETKFELMQQASALLAFSPEDQVKPYSDLYSSNRWEELANIFVQTFQELHGLPHRSLFLQYLATGITALKTHSCELPEAQSTEEEGELTLMNAATPKFRRQHKVDLTRGYMCPVCSLELRHIARPLPYALHNHSHLDPDPVLLPNDRIYGLEKLLDYAKKAGVAFGKIIDPVTLEVYERSAVVSVYPT